MQKLNIIKSGFLLLSSCIVGALSCTKADVSFGSQFSDNDYVQYQMTDTLQPVISTVFVDSFATSGSGVGLLGSYTDPQFGKIQASSYYQIQPPTYSANNEDSFRNAIYDSITLLVKFVKINYYGDTAVPMTLNVNRLTTNIDYFNNQTTLFNTQSFSYESTPLGTRTFSLLPSETVFSDTMSVRLSDVLGRDLWQKMTTSDVTFQTDERFINYFKGIRLSTNNVNGFVAGISDSITMRIHYRAATATAVEGRTALFVLNTKALQFNHIDIDRSGTVLGQNGLSRLKNEIPSTVTGNRSYLQYITGSAIKISFPNIENMLKLNGFLRLSKAILYIKPVPGTYQSNYALPTQLRLSQTDYDNGIGSDLVSGSSVQTGNLNLDYANVANTRYSYDLTTYINYIASKDYKAGDGLLLTPPASANTTQFNRLIMGDYNGPTNGQVRLQIFYLAAQ